MTATIHIPPSILVRAQSGDLAAFTEIARRIEPVLLRHVKRIVGASAASDVLQETLLRTWRGLKWLDKPEAFAAWVFRISTREAYRVLKRERMRAEVPVDDDEFEKIQADFLDPSQRLDAERALAKVTPLARLVVAAHYFEGLSLPELSEAIGIPLGTVKSRLASGLAQLRMILGNAR